MHKKSFPDTPAKSDNIRRTPLPKGKAEADPGVKHHAAKSHMEAGAGKLKEGEKK